MAKRSKPKPRFTAEVQRGDATHEPPLAEEIAGGAGSELIVSNLAIEAAPLEDVRRKVANALDEADTTGTQWITISQIGRMLSYPHRDTQQLVDRFVTARDAVESWARDAGLEVAEAFLRPFDDTFSAVFKLEPNGRAPADTRGRARMGGVGDVPIEDQPRQAG